MSTRRNLCAGLPLGLLLAQVVGAQRGLKIIGLLNPSTSRESDRIRAIFNTAMLELGYVKGIHYDVIERSAEGKLERLRELADELVKLRVAIILTAATNAVRAAQQATPTIPIVLLRVVDPVGSGFAESMAHPGRNMTGMANLSIELNPKRFELLKQMVPSLTRVAILTNPTNEVSTNVVQRMRALAERLGLQALFAKASTPEELEPAFQTMTQQRAEAVMVMADSFFFQQRQRIAQLALLSRLPSMFPEPEFAEVGGLMSYGGDGPAQIRRTAAYVDKIFKGAKPGELPIEQPTEVSLIVNRKTADGLRMTVPAILLLQAEKVIE